MNTCKESLPDGVNEDSDDLFSIRAEREKERERERKSDKQIERNAEIKEIQREKTQEKRSIQDRK